MTNYGVVPVSELRTARHFARVWKRLAIYWHNEAESEEEAGAILARRIAELEQKGEG